VRIESTFCDVHPAEKLARGAVKFAGRYEAQTTLCCTVPECHRQFHYDYGYFDFLSGQETDLGDLKAKPRCSLKHDLIYMLLTKVDGQNVYACFHPDCTNTLPYSA
jgi:hypothetical protein